MADLQPYRFEPERVLNAQDRERENEEVNDRLEGTLSCFDDECEAMATEREPVCYRKQPEQTKGKE